MGTKRFENEKKKKEKRKMKKEKKTFDFLAISLFYRYFL